MKLIFATLALAASALAAAPAPHGGGGSKPTCDSHQTVVCKDNGNGGLLSLGNIASGAAGSNCAGGDTYCCSSDDVNNVRINISHTWKLF